jgi:betaine-aldehyde dehydrogenase
MMRAQPEASHFIHGEPADEPAGEPFDVLYPATAETIARLHAATPAILAQALDSACDGFRAWSATPPAARTRVLRRAAESVHVATGPVAALF